MGRGKDQNASNAIKNIEMNLNGEKEGKMEVRKFEDNWDDECAFLLV